MKPDITEAPVLSLEETTPLWRSLDEYMGSPEFHKAMENEFPENAAEWTDPVTRRSFLSLMGASLALAGAAGCSPRPASVRKLVPYTRQPEEMTPGNALFFASAFPLGGYTTGVLVRSQEGRPVKVEGNPDHPSSLGGTDMFAQASVLDLYDPDRSKDTLQKGIPAVYENAVRAIRTQLDQHTAKKGAGLRILTETVTSPTLASQLEALLKNLPEAKWVQYDALSRDNVHEGSKKAFGKVMNVSYDFTKADIVLSLDADFLSVGPGHVRYCRDFASRRKIRQSEKDGIKPDQMSRLYVVECMPTSTGSVADHKLPMRSRDVEAFARALAVELKVPSAPAAGLLTQPVEAWIKPLAKDLTAHREKCIVVAGENQPASVHALAHAINSTLGNIGKTVKITAPIEARAGEQLTEFRTLVKDMADKKVETILILGGNPAYTAAADLKFVEALKNVPFKAHLGLHPDETAVLADWHIPEAHYLETWGDGRGHDGTVAIQQVLIAPLYSGKSAIELIADLTGAPFREGREIVKLYWQKWFDQNKKSGEFDTFWQNAVRVGVVPESAPALETPALAGNWSAGSAPPASALSADDLEINFRPDPTLYDGRFANNGWLQEVPKPVTKMTWDNVAFVGPETGKKLGIEKEFAWTAGEHGRVEVSIIELRYKDRTIKAPVWAVPGHADGAVTIHLGYGRERAGRVGNTPNEPNADGKPIRGFNAYAIRTSEAPWTDGGLKIAKAGGTYYLACVQANWVMEQKDPISGAIIDRKPVRRATLEQYKKNPEFSHIPPGSPAETTEINDLVPKVKSDHAHGEPHEPGHDSRLMPLTMYQGNDNLYPHALEGHKRRWAMAIDLSACTGCNACVVACVGENNIPVVGKREVTRGHEMHWIRVDRYYAGPPDKPDGLKTYFQPVPCQQCEKAPCEVVCPVGATVHSADGLNDMVYNRCVGTRYCSNNCPYKVRRFNFLTFQDWATESIKLGRNPDVSVRSRGVMEKCTYCVQRIRGAEIVAEREGRPIRDGEVITACQSACPSAAIMFGDLNDEHGAVGRWKAEPTNYGLLAELNTMPRTTYLASVRNPNPDPDMPKGA